MRISELQFVDLYIGEGYCDIKGLAGASAPRVEAPPELKEEIDAIREECRRIYEKQGDPEFSLKRDDILYRVTYLEDAWAGGVFVLRRSSASIRPIESLGLFPPFLETVLDKKTRGLVLIAGEMGKGKTTTAASIVVARLQRHGGIAVAIEDPPETALNGVHGMGRCIQVQASRKSGGYREHLIRALRSGADDIFIGEIRDADTAAEAIQAGINGHFILATIHASSIEAAIERVATLSDAYFSSGIETAYSNLSLGLKAVLWQTLDVPLGQNGNVVKRLRCKSLVIDGDASGVKSKIASGKIGLLGQDIDEQQRKAKYAAQWSS